VLPQTVCLVSNSFHCASFSFGHKSDLVACVVYGSPCTAHMLLMPQIQLVLQQNFSIELLGIQWYSLPEGPFHGLLRDFLQSNFTVVPLLGISQRLPGNCL